VLTGAIGSGKSTVGFLLAAKGARVIDADRIGHAVIDPRGSAFAEVAARWPDTLVDGRIDRARLGTVVFADPGQLQELEEITHPRIVARLGELLADSTVPVVVVEISVPHLPVDAGWGRIVVTAGDHMRRRRLIERGLHPDEAEQRMAAQPPAGEWVEPGDIVVDNNGDIQQLRSEVDRVLDLVVPTIPR
jgi:dephospho-CoA kinase